MRPQPENDLVYLLMILESIGKINIYSEGFKQAIQFFRKDDQINFNASLLLLANIGEQAGKISEATKVKYSQVLWRQIKELISRELDLGVFLREEFEIAAASQYYSHVDFNAMR